MLVGLHSVAAVPVPSALPHTPTWPASVVTLPVSAISTSPAGVSAIPPVSTLIFAKAPVPSWLPGPSVLPANKDRAVAGGGGGAGVSLEPPPQDASTGIASEASTLQRARCGVRGLLCIKIL